MLRKTFPSVPVLFPSFQELREFRDPNIVSFLMVINGLGNFFPNFRVPPPLRLLRQPSELSESGRGLKKAVGYYPKWHS